MNMCFSFSSVNWTEYIWTKWFPKTVLSVQTANNVNPTLSCNVPRDQEAALQQAQLRVLENTFHVTREPIRNRGSETEDFHNNTAGPAWLLEVLLFYMLLLKQLSIKKYTLDSEAWRLFVNIYDSLILKPQGVPLKQRNCVKAYLDNEFSCSCINPFISFFSL